jgi:hypothetical protein
MERRNALTFFIENLQNSLSFAPALAHQVIST